jgi:uridine kinase
MSTLIEPALLVIVEGVYTSRPELADRWTCVSSSRVPGVRAKRLLNQGTIGRWEIQWHGAEDWYFATVASPAHDRTVDNH